MNDRYSNSAHSIHKNQRVTTFITLIWLCLTSGSLQAGELIFATQDFPPFSYLRGVTVHGPGADIINEACQLAKMECQVKLLPWANAIKNVKEGKAHGLFFIGKTAEREQWLSYTTPLVKSSYAFFVNSTDSKAYARLSDFNGYKVGVKAKSHTESVLKSKIPEIGQVDIQSRPSDFATMRKLSGGSLNAIFINSDVAKNIAKIDGFQVKSALVVEEFEYHIGLSLKYMPEGERQKFNKAIAELESKGTLASILKSYDLTSTR